MNYLNTNMATASGMPDRQQRLLLLIECPICLNEQQDPRILSCRHIYCYKCLKDYHEKGNHGNGLSCPQCREVTTLYQGGVDNLPKFFFMNELREVVMAEDGAGEDTPQKHRGVVCSTEDCGQPGLKYCMQCEFLCQQCYDEHSKSRFTKSHQVITASEGEAFIKSKVPPYPPCHSHTHQVMDLYCLQCDQPMCNTCSNSIHDGHKRCGLDQQAKVCKTKLEQISDDTDCLIKTVKQAIDKTRSQVKQAEADIDDACENVKSAFKIMHDKLNKEEDQILTELTAVHRRVKKTGDVTLDSQSMTLAGLESIKSCQVKLDEKDSPYDYVTVTDSLEKDVKNQCKDLQGIIWSCKIERKNKSGVLHNKGRVDLTELVMTKKVNIAGSGASDKQVEEVTGSVESDKQVEIKEVSRIRLHTQDKCGVWGMVVYNQRVYVVHDRSSIVYCYTPDGSFSHKYEHKGGTNSTTSGLCLMVDGDKSRLVVSDGTKNTLVWITIVDELTMTHHRTQQVGYWPRGSYCDNGNLMVCDADNHKIHRYRHDGQTLDVINLSGNVNPHWVTCHSDDDVYIISDFLNDKVVMIDNKGQVKKCYKGDIHGRKLGGPREVITDPQRGVLIADRHHNQVLLLRRTGDVVKILDQHVRSPGTLYLDTDHHRLYVSGTDQHETQHVFIFDYSLSPGCNKLTMKVTKLDMNVEI